MHIEAMEARRLLTAVLANGVLTITGDAADNHVALMIRTNRTAATDDDMLLVIESLAPVPDTAPDPESTDEPSRRERQRPRNRRGPGRGSALRRLNVPGRVPFPNTRTEFSASAVTSIMIDLGAGDDSVSVRRDVAAPATITGGDGNDLLSAGGGASTLNGNAGNDRLSAGPGAATLNGGDGHDLLLGGPAADVLNGDAGNDTLISFRGGKDTVNGGTDGPVDGESGDIAFVDATSQTDPDTGEVREADVVTNVEASRSGRGRGSGWGHFDFAPGIANIFRLADGFPFPGASGPFARF